MDGISILNVCTSESQYIKHANKAYKCGHLLVTEQVGSRRRKQRKRVRERVREREKREKRET